MYRFGGLPAFLFLLFCTIVAEAKISCYTCANDFIGKLTFTDPTFAAWCFFELKLITYELT
jgi:hypothetical protein